MIKDWTLYSLVFFVTLMLGYYLGITISTVVDYRLKDAVINMPRPKNNIKIVVSKKPKKVKVKSNKKEIEHFLNYKELPKTKTKTKKSSNTKKITSNECLLDLHNPVKENREQYYNKQINDSEIETYSKLYKQNKEKQEQNLKKNRFIPYNEEDNSLNYMNIKHGLNPNNRINLKQKGKDLIWKTLPNRKKRGKKFKCQRDYMTCSSNHNI
jgi:hypothetical protein